MRWYLPDRWPVFWHEVRRLISQRHARMVGILLLSVPALYYFIIFSSIIWVAKDELWPNFGYFHKTFSFILWQATVFIEEVVIVIVGSVLASGSILRERNRRTLEALLLSRLSSSEFILGKYWAYVLPLTLMVLAFLPMAIYLWLTGPFSIALYLFGNLSLLMYILCYPAIGMYYSVKIHNVVSAQAAAIATVFGLHVLLFIPAAGIAMTNGFTAVSVYNAAVTYNICRFCFTTFPFLIIIVSCLESCIKTLEENRTT